MATDGEFRPDIPGTARMYDCGRRLQRQGESLSLVTIGMARWLAPDGEGQFSERPGLPGPGQLAKYVITIRADTSLIRRLAWTGFLLVRQGRTGDGNDADELSSPA